MRVFVRVYGSLQRTSAVGQEEKVVEINDGWRVRDLLEDVNIWESDARAILINGRKARLDRRLRNRDRIELSSERKILRPE